MHRFVRGAGVGAIAVAVMLAGCSGSGGSGTGGSASPAAGSSDGAVQSPAPADSVASQGGTTATCKQLTFDEVQPLLAAPIANVVVTAAGIDSTGQECRFVAAEESESVDVTVIGGSDGSAEYDNDVSEFPSPAPLPGVGDKATRDKDDESSSFAALKGDVYCSVNVDDENVPGVGALMDLANNTLRIGDANYAVITSALATLCNRIYGSGNTTVDLSGLAPGPPVSPDLP